MATTRTVFTHWWDTKSPSPPPTSTIFPYGATQLGSYPGATVGNAPPPPPLLSNPNVLYTLYCELARQDHIDNLGWAGPTWPGPPPPAPDEGYSTTATDFSVTKVEAGAAAGSLGTAFRYTLYPPPGAAPVGTSFVLDPTNGYSAALPSPINGRGIWIVEVTYYPGPSGTTSSQAFNGPAPVYEPFFSPYGSPNEGILYIRFTGDEVSGCCGATVTWAQKDCSSGSVKRPVEISTVLQAPSTGACSAQWTLRKKLGGGAVGSPTYGAMFGAPAGAMTTPSPWVDTFLVDPGDYVGELKYGFPHQNCPGATLDPITVDPCPPPSCPSCTVTPPSVTGCAGQGATFSSNLIANPCSWPAGATAITPTAYLWTITSPSGKQFKRSTTTPIADATGWKDPSGATVNLPLNEPGTYSVAVIPVIPGLSLETCDPTATTQFVVPECCPTVTLTPPTVSGCAPTNAALSSPITASVTSSTGPPLLVSAYEWKITTPSGKVFTRTTSVPATDATGWTDSAGTLTTLPLSEIGTFQVTVDAHITTIAQGCNTQASASFTVPGCPPPKEDDDKKDDDNGRFKFPNWACAILLILALAGLAVALVAAFMAGCALAGGAPVGGGLIAAVLIGFGAFLLFIILWGALCAKSHCGVLCALITTVMTLIALAAIALFFLALFGNPCFLGAIFDGALLGLALAVLIRIAQAVGCPIPVWPSFKCPP